MKYFVMILVLFTTSFAQTSETNTGYIDEMHDGISKKVIEWSQSIDNSLCVMLGNKESNVSKPKVQNNYQKKSKRVDSFFQNQRYFDETDNTFIRLHTQSLFQSRNSNDFHFLISGQIPLSRSREKFKLFIDDLNVENAKNITDETIRDNDLLPDIGIRYIMPKSYYRIYSRYALGLSGLHPFVSTRLNYPVKYDQWLIDTVQSLKYSTNEKFEEETNIYFDRPLNDLSLFRLQLHRKTQTEVDGMNYALFLQYYWSLKGKSGMRLSQSFFGNTEYTYQNDTGHFKHYSGINSYVTSFSWRENIWRDWFYYEIRPSVNFHKENGYKPNYAIYLLFDFYFGEIINF